MSSIKVLSQSVADKIAAGEVAERPSAVVKELVENSIDAGATRIQVEIKDGGISYIRVEDNGSGIPFDQVETAFLRHATSKLSEIDDLYRISTMGFRGEALASICAVADVEVITKTNEAEEGAYLKISHSVPDKKELIACGNGTTMIIRELFANVPARMKFLKKNSTESGYVADVLSRIALSKPEISISYICDGKEIFSTSGDGKLNNVILNIYGLDHAKAVIPVDYTEGNIRISGVIGKPELARGNRTRQTLFVNGRYIKNHIVSKVTEEAYRNTIMTGKFPFFVLNIELPSELVDVNVHPAKTEVKFADEKQIYDVAYHAIKNSIYKEEPKEVKPAPVSNNFYVAKDYSNKVDRETVREFLNNTIPPMEVPVKTTLVLNDSITTDRKPQEILEELLEETPQKGAEQISIPETQVENEKKKATVIGQLFDTYIICQRDDKMELIDQHAAHERMRFEKLKEAYFKKERLSQMLLTPMVITLNFAEKQVVMDNITEFIKFGFDIEDMGGNSVIIHGTPVVADLDVIYDLVLELSQVIANQIKHPVADFEERALDMISCKYAIKANKKLSYVEMEDLVKKVNEMEEDGIKTCPHGRPIRVEFTKTEIEKLFKRIV